MYYLALLVPFFMTLGFYFFRKNQFKWWEFFIPIGVVLITIVISKLIIDTSSVKFTEYWGSTVTAIYEQEPYNYWQHQTCSYTTTDSKGNSTTHYYDCSHQVDEAPKWYAVTDLKESFTISEKDYDQLSLQFKNQRQIVDTKDNYAPRDRCVGSDGTKFEGKSVGNQSYTYEVVWNKDDNTRKALTSRHNYVNKIKATDLSIFNISLVNEKQADSLKLFKYPLCKNDNLFQNTNGLNYPTILGGNVSDTIHEKFRRLNGKFGVSNELRLWILIFEDKPLSIAKYQENYWVRGNMNELVVCIGVKDNQIQWSYPFSWALSNELTIDVRDKIMNLYQYKDTIIKRQIPIIANKLTKKLKMPIQYADSTLRVKSPNYPVLTNSTWNELYTYLDSNLYRFHRRSFKEFDYLTVEPSKGAIIFIWILALLISVGVNVWVITNEFNEDN